MLSSRSDIRKRLTVQAPDPATEIFVVNGQFRRIASAMGSLSIDVPEGIYKIRFRSGSEQQDQLVDVSGEHEEVIVRGAPLNFKSAAPLSNTSSKGEFHLAIAADQSRKVHFHAGRGSQLFLFTRDLIADAASPPWEGVSLHNLDGERVADFANGICIPEKKYGALNMEVDPGTYRLRVETGKLGTIEMFLVAVPGWQTQIFLLATDFYVGKEHVRRAGLKKASVLMSHAGAGFNPGNDHVRLAELARQGLESGRNIMKSADLKRMLSEKFEDPMLGIYGAHLLLRARRPDHALLDIVAGNLTRMIGPHPDVLALKLRKRGKSKKTPAISFPSPPMLQNSWRLIVRQSLERVATVPPGSPAERFADNLLSSSPWLLHQLPEGPISRPAMHSFAQVKRRLLSFVEIGATGARERIITQVQNRPSDFSALEKSMINLTFRSEKFADDLSGQKSPRATSQETTVSRIIRNLDALPSSISRTVDALSEKLNIGDDR